ncbi:hypothetical protein TNCV_2425771 [Trichonephila clavipes]|nr:hypothetical protein TNCV_2425771 [Trichonephila clavipes]
MKGKKSSIVELICAHRCKLASRVTSDELLKRAPESVGRPARSKAMLAVGAARNGTEIRIFGCQRRRRLYPNELGDEATQKQVGVEAARMREEPGRNPSPKGTMEGEVTVRTDPVSICSRSFGVVDV